MDKVFMSWGSKFGLRLAKTSAKRLRPQCNRRLAPISKAQGNFLLTYTLPLNHHQAGSATGAGQCHHRFAVIPRTCPEWNLNPQLRVLLDRNTCLKQLCYHGVEVSSD